jgi:hypothetical protein
MFRNAVTIRRSAVTTRLVGLLAALVDGSAELHFSARDNTEPGQRRGASV